MSYRFVRKDADGKLYLHLSSGDHRSKICLGTLSDGILRVVRDPRRDFSTRFNGYGLNYRMLRRVQFDQIEVQLTTGWTLQVSKERFLREGTVPAFAQKLVTAKIFLPVNRFKIKSSPAGREEN